MPRKLRQLKQDLRKAGFEIVKGGGKGSHSKWEHPKLPGVTVVLSGQDGEDADRYQERDVRVAIARLSQSDGEA